MAAAVGAGVLSSSCATAPAPRAAAYRLAQTRPVVMMRDGSERTKEGEEGRSGRQGGSGSPWVSATPRGDLSHATPVLTPS